MQPVRKLFLIVFILKCLCRSTAKYSCTEEYQKTLGDVDDNISHHIGIIGCRSTISEISLDCRECGLAIFNSEQTNESNRILNIGNYNVELITLPTLPKQLTDILVLKDMILLHDDTSLCYCLLSKAIPILTHIEKCYGIWKKNHNQIAFSVRKD